MFKGRAEDAILSILISYVIMLIKANAITGYQTSVDERENVNKINFVILEDRLKSILIFSQMY